MCLNQGGWYEPQIGHVLGGNMKKTDHLEDLSLARKAILKSMLKK